VIIFDTNVLLRASLDDDSRQSRIAQKYLAEADQIVIPLYAFCEFVWVMSRSYKLRRETVVSSVLRLTNAGNVICNEEAVEAGLTFFAEGGDFADGVIEFEGRKLGGDTFATFDKEAAAIIRANGRDCLLLDAN
jgi:predicted nucleic-acid-binding protein